MNRDQLIRNVSKCRSQAMNRDQLIRNVSKRAEIQETWYVRSHNLDDVIHQFNFCSTHARMVARVESIIQAIDTQTDVHFSESDSADRCEFYGCDVALAANGITDYGVNSALGLTDSDPKNVHVYIEELELAARAMSDDDPRWILWEHHALRALRKERKRNKR